MRMPFSRPLRMPLWIAGILLCLLAASGIVAIVSATPTSYASIPDEDAPSNYAQAPSGEDARAKDLLTRSALPPAARSNRAWCPACGVVESMRQIERSGDVGERATVNTRIAGVASGGAIAADDMAGERHELTVRFRDGSMMVLNEPTRRSWQLGNRVIVIGGANPASR